MIKRKINTAQNIESRALRSTAGLRAKLATGCGLRAKLATGCGLQKERRFLVLSATFFTLSFLARLFFAGQSAAKNVELRDLYVTKQDLQQQISRLKYDDLRVSSIAYVEEKAKQQGFAPMTGFLLALDVTVSPPLASASPTR